MIKFKIYAGLLLVCCTLALSAKDYKASLFGVKSDGITMNTGSIQKAVDLISSKGGGRLVFYVGRYLTGSIQLRSNVTIHLEEGAVLVGVPTVYDYGSVNGVKALIFAEAQDSIGITGKGVIEGQGPAVLDHIRAQIEKGYLKETPGEARPALIAMNGCSVVTIEGINLFDACGDVQLYRNCSGLTISTINVKSVITDGSCGLVLSGCRNVRLSDSFFHTSGLEISSVGPSNDVRIAGCVNEDGKKLHP
ncbi:MAG: glycosyl hydrolase family 28 protein [Prolixibacteraceae bacterium]